MSLNLQINQEQRVDKMIDLVTLILKKRKRTRKRINFNFILKL